MDFVKTQNLLEAETSKLFKQAAHDIRSPLSVLSLIACSEKISMCEESRELIRTAIKRINDIATGLLANEMNIQGGKRPSVQNKTISVKCLIESVVSEKKILNRDRNLEFKIIYRGGQDRTLPDLGGDFERALSNLLDNAIEAIVNKAGKIVISVTEKMGRLFLRITDNGKGIPHSVIASIGTEGFSYGKKKMVSGFGLGVFQARAAAESVGGTLKFHSLEGRGTTVSMEIPTGI